MAVLEVAVSEACWGEGDAGGGVQVVTPAWTESVPPVAEAWADVVFWDSVLFAAAGVAHRTAPTSATAAEVSSPRGRNRSSCAAWRPSRSRRRPR